jgi:hypothetical protein
VGENVRDYSKYLNIRSLVVFGGVSINPQMMKPDILTHLRRQFAGRRQDQGAHRTAPLRVRLILGQALQQRQRKAGGLSISARWWFSGA